jgi:hypothetical protein
MRIRMLIPFMVVIVVAAGCGSSDETTTTSAAATATTAASTDTTAADETTTTAAEAATTTVAIAAGGPACLVGTWLIDSDGFLESLRQVFADEAAGGEISEIKGAYTIEMAADGTLNGERDEWGFVVLTAEGTVDLTMDGTETGTWTATDDAITVEITTSDMSVSVTVSSGGQTFTLDDSPVDVPEVITSASQYSCDGDSLSVVSDGVTFVLIRA